MTAAPVLAVEHLAVSFAQYDRGLRRRTLTPVVDMSLTVPAGEVVAVVGASGAGKSLVGLAVMGLLPPNAEEAGRVMVQGREVDPAGRRGLAGSVLALLPQSGAFLDPTARVGAQVRRAAELAGRPDPEGELSRVLESRGLPPDTARRFPHELSGGMVRRLLFGIATIGRPALVFADEPTPGLHPESAAAVLADIRALADDGVAVVLVTHDVDQALTVADRLVVVRSGRTVEEARPEQFAGDGGALVDPYSRELWRALPGHGFVSPGRLGA